MTTDVTDSDDAASRAPRDIRVLIADDEALIRAGFTVLVNSAPGITVVGEASDGVQAVRQARALRPDVVLMDIRMPVMGGLEATKIILDEGVQEPPPRILVVTTFDEDEHVFAAFARQPHPAAKSAQDALAQLTERELDVLKQVAAGKSNPEVADALYLSVTTVKTHISRLLDKLGCCDRAQLVVVAYETGAVTVAGERAIALITPAPRLGVVRQPFGCVPSALRRHLPGGARSYGRLGA